VERKKVLERGCGIGTDSLNFARNGAHLTAVDLSERSLEICRQRFQVYGLLADLYCGNIEDREARNGESTACAINGLHGDQLACAVYGHE